MSYRRNTSFQLTPITGIIGVSALLSIISLIVPQVYNFLALSPSQIARQPWTIVTSIFMHAPPLWPNFYHLLFNMLTLYFFGSYLSRFIGERKMLAIFFIGALLGNVVYILIAFTPLGDPFSWVVGASGGVIALGGALAVLTPKTKVLIFGIIPAPLWLAVVGSFVVLSFFRNVAWEAHLGGLLLGAAAGYYFKRRLRRNYWW